MKKVSAFSVFSAKGKKAKGGQDASEPSPVMNGVDDGNRKSSLRRAASTPESLGDQVGHKKDSETKGKKFLKVLKGGSLRGSIRSSTKKRPSILHELPNDSPYVASNGGCQLTALKQSAPNPMGSNMSIDSIGAGKKKASPAQEKGSAGKSTNTKKGQLPKPGITSPVIDGSLPPTGKVPKTKSPGKPAMKRKLNTPPSLEKKKQKMEESNENTNIQNTSQISGVAALQEQEADSNEDEGPATPNLPYMYDSGEQARKTFECLIHPLTTDRFFKELWERKPLLVKRHIPHYNDGWFSSAQLDKILREENVQFSVNLDVTTFEKGKRETHNISGRAYAPVVWDYYQNGCSVRLLNPQTYSRNVWKLLAILQEYFGCFVGANVYLTPPGTQGFAPHYDDIEAFILQLEGKKHWRLYSPRNKSEILPRFSSANLTDEDLGEPILDVMLEAGDMLYFPRGTIHQGRTTDEEHSLHITVSCYQKNTWGDLLEKLMPQALQLAIDENVEFRRGLPRDFLSYMGVANSDKECPERKEFMKKIEQLMATLVKYAPVDAAADQLGKRAIHDALPPLLSEAEKACSIHGTGERWDDELKRVVGTVELDPDTTIKIIRRGVVRLVSEDEQVRIYHCLENSRVYHDTEPQYIEIITEAAPAVEFLIHSYPEYVTIDSLPLENLQDRIDLARDLYEKGLLITGETLEPLYEESEEDQS